MCQSCLSWYARCIAPYLVHAGCSANVFARMRRRLIPRAQGIVVEVGFGSGLNLPYYDAARVERLVGIDPDGTMLGLAEPKIRSLPFDVDCIRASGERLPLIDGLADTVVVTYAFCTIPDPDAALTEIRRILKPMGRLIFIEHGQAEGPRGRRWQERLNKPWGQIAGGCHLNRQPLHLIREAGFRIVEEERGRFPLPFWQLGSHYAGVAVLRQGDGPSPQARSCITRSHAHPLPRGIADDGRRHPVPDARGHRRWREGQLLAPELADIQTGCIHVSDGALQPFCYQRSDH
ncbi:class I SAM-dependent methyltransferase [Mesorhizobium sp. BR1-1-12]|uniref:class I SAM-dependent methyltransferase n=2 Tax=Mesorhizobium TaxID=68287 RepID=UPI001CD0515E|nr:class I SAM-dependent methyltransferase [Mesorhizobium sp. BR1-1-12]MBZ9971494.1 class I SAM-dependent methyltransferase [Mesorhizobium sp. BR1-1-12]